MTRRIHAGSDYTDQGICRAGNLAPLHVTVLAEGNLAEQGNERASAERNASVSTSP
jgi:hypothetical protein